MPPTAVFFDMDGVLLDSFEAWLAVMNAASIHFDCPPVARDVFREAFGQSTQADAEQFYHGRTASEVDAFYIAHFHEHAALATATPGAQHLLDELDARGIPTAVITNTHSEIARPLLEGLNLIPHALIAPDDVKDALAEADVLRRNFNQLVVLNEVEGLFEGEDDGGVKADRDLRRCFAHVREFALFADVEIKVAITRMHAYDHSLVDLRLGLDERVPTLLRVLYAERDCYPRL